MLIKTWVPQLSLSLFKFNISKVAQSFFFFIFVIASLGYSVYLSGPYWQYQKLRMRFHISGQEAISTALPCLPSPRPPHLPSPKTLTEPHGHIHTDWQTRTYTYTHIIYYIYYNTPKGIQKAIYFVTLSLDSWHSDCQKQCFEICFSLLASQGFGFFLTIYGES